MTKTLFRTLGASFAVAALAACASTPAPAPVFASSSEANWYAAETSSAESARSLRDAQRDLDKIEKEQKKLQKNIERATRDLDRQTPLEADARARLTEAQSVHAVRVADTERARLLMEAEKLEAKAAMNRAAASIN